MPASHFDLLLEYLSAVESGSWQSFRQAVNVAAESDYREEAPRKLASIVAENLAALGHIEFAFDGTLDWETAPATIAGAPSLGDGHGVLCGGRTNKLVESVMASAQDLKVELSMTQQRLAPSAVVIRAKDNSTLEQLASRIKLRFEPDAGTRLGMCLPSLASMRASAPLASLPSGFPVKQFDVEALDWVPVDQAQGDGSYWFECYRPEYRVVSNRNSSKVSRSVAIFAALAHARKHVIQYLSAEKELVIPSNARLPVLHLRVLVLCSGRLPEYNPSQRTLRFTAISPVVALAVAKGLEGERG